MRVGWEVGGGGEGVREGVLGGVGVGWGEEGGEGGEGGGRAAEEGGGGGVGHGLGEEGLAGAGLPCGAEERMRRARAVQASGAAKPRGSAAVSLHTPTPLHSPDSTRDRRRGARKCKRKAGERAQ